MNYFNNNIERITDLIINLLPNNRTFSNEYLKDLAKKSLLNSPQCNHERNNADWVITYLANDAIKLMKE
jgi:hypothetical protein